MKHLVDTPAESPGIPPVGALVELVRGVDRSIEKLLCNVVESELVDASSDSVLLEAMAVAAGVQRRLDGLMAELVGEADARSASRPNAGGLAASIGCRNVNDLVQAVTLASPHAVAASLRVARKVRRGVGIASGAFLPPELPALRQALLEGAVSVDAVSGLLGPLQDLHVAVGATIMRQAEGQLAAAARGACCAEAAELVGGGFACSSNSCSGEPPSPLGVRDLRSLAQALAFHLDPDGAEPRDARALRKRGITFGIPRDGLVPLSGHTLVEVAAQFQRISDAMLNPKLAGPRFRPARADDGGQATDDGDSGEGEGDPTDLRTRAQKQHDVLATVFSIAARSGELPTLGGDAPTLVVSVKSEDLDSGRGFAVVDGVDEPLSIHAARQIGCESTIQRIRIKDGRIHSLGITNRVFDHWQRKAIVLRDGACVIPGCGVPAGWCELHHVVEYAEGGPTHTDNGVLLCWWHHRALGSHDGWEVRMQNGSPEARPPSWHDAFRRWRPVGKSRLHPPPSRGAPTRG